MAPVEPTATPAHASAETAENGDNGGLDGILPGLITRGSSPWVPTDLLTPSQVSTSALAAAARLELLRGKSDLLMRFMRLIIPVLVEVYAVSVALNIRTRALTGMLKAASFLIRRPRVGGHTRTGTITDFDVYNLRGARDDTTRIANSLYPFTSYRFDHIFSTGEGDTGVKSRPPQEQIPASAFDLIGTSFHLSNSQETYTWLIQAYAARVIFQLSCSNWSVVLAKIRQKIRQFAERGVDDKADVNDIYIIKYSALTRKKLIAIMQGELFG